MFTFIICGSVVPFFGTALPLIARRHSLGPAIKRHSNLAPVEIGTFLLVVSATGLAMLVSERWSLRGRFQTFADLASIALLVTSGIWLLSLIAVAAHRKSVIRRTRSDNGGKTSFRDFFE